VSATAELIADRGEAASADEFFRSPPFLEAEGVTHTLRIAAADLELLAPLIVRPIPDTDEIDATSPYGYPGFAIAGGSIGGPIGHQKLPRAIDPTAVDFSATGLVSLFVRNALGDPPLAGARNRNLVQIADPSLPRKSRGSDRNQINRNRRAGYEVRVVPGPETSAGERNGFRAAYEQTMRRTAAADHYFFGAAYFDRILASPLAWLATAAAPGGDAAAASLTVRSDGFLHYYLSGSADAHLRDSPMKSVVAALVELAAELDLPLNLGGGIFPGDRLEEFKRGFANREQAWQTTEIVCDRAAYERLCGERRPSGFFPAYRAS
jgi:hypothetical protein